jgi:diaminopimelate decarboxylase
MHMMTGSCVLNAAYWDETVTVLVDTVARVHDELGITFDFVNIGGGLGIPYRTGQEVVDVPAIAAQLAACVKARWAATGLAAKGLPTPSLFMENGRYMTGPFGFLVARCEVVKDTWARYYGLDACMSNLMRPGMYGSYHHITVPAREGLALDGGGVPRASANVVGTLCENNDWFAKDRDLPAAAAVGDLFVIHDTGAHSHSMGFQYNGKLRAPELLLRGGGKGSGGGGAGSSAAPPFRVDLIRERESISCLYDNTMLPKDLEPPAASLARPYPYSGRAASVAGPRRASIVVAAEDVLTRTHTLSVAALALAIVGVAVAVGRRASST